MKVIVRNGTNAGCKPPLRDRPKEWSCLCSTLGVADGPGICSVFKRQPGYLVSCPDCGAARPPAQ